MPKVLQIYNSHKNFIPFWCVFCSDATNVAVADLSADFEKKFKKIVYQLQSKTL